MVYGYIRGVINYIDNIYKDIIMDNNMNKEAFLNCYILSNKMIWLYSITIKNL